MISRTTWSRRSALLPGPTTSSSLPICPRPGAGRSCADCSRTSPKGATLGDTTTLADPNVVNRLKEMYEEKEG